MDKYCTILGDGQVWDVRGVSPEAPEATFEDLFSGRALGRMAREANLRPSLTKGAFSPYRQKGRITGVSVTRALLSSNARAQRAARSVLDEFARMAALGIQALHTASASKRRWSAQEQNHWRNLDVVIIGGGVSEEETGRFLVRLISRHLARLGLSHIRLLQACFPGKEAGFIGAVIRVIRPIIKEALQKKVRTIAAIGLDVGRDEIGVGLLALTVPTGRLVRHRQGYWFFRKSVKTAPRGCLVHFFDARRDYSARERKLGRRMRSEIMQRMVALIAEARQAAQEKGLVCARHICVAVPGRVVDDGAIADSTDYLPFFRQRDGFNFGRSLERMLHSEGLQGIRVKVVNDGIAAGIANAYFDRRVNGGKFAFLGVGSGLGGCVGRVRIR